MFEKGKLAPDITIVDAQGEKHQSWDFRNRGHIVFVVASDGGKEALKQAEAHKTTWNWLGLRWFAAASPDIALAPGLYVIDRFGTFVTHLTIDAEVWEKLEKEIIYHEARHC